MELKLNTDIEQRRSVDYSVGRIILYDLHNSGRVKLLLKLKREDVW